MRNKLLLITHPSPLGIYVIRGVDEPFRQYSGYTDENILFAQDYREKLYIFYKKLKRAVKCDTNIAYDFLKQKFSCSDIFTIQEKYFIINDTPMIQLYDIIFENLIFDDSDKVSFKISDFIICCNSEILDENKYKPSLIRNELYHIYDICKDVDGNQHLDVGLISNLNFVSSNETGERLPHSGIGETHWCNSSRFKRVKNILK